MSRAIYRTWFEAILAVGHLIALETFVDLQAAVCRKMLRAVDARWAFINSFCTAGQDR